MYLTSEGLSTRHEVTSRQGAPTSDFPPGLGVRPENPQGHIFSLTKDKVNIKVSTYSPTPRMGEGCEGAG